MGWLLIVFGLFGVGLDSNKIPAYMVIGAGAFITGCEAIADAIKKRGQP